MQKTRKKLLFSVLSLVLCFALLAGTTFAWFTDSVTSANNIITSGNLDIEMYWTDDLASDVWYNVEDAQYNTIFSYDNWEPGYTDVKYIKLVNNGSLAINYQLLLTPQGQIGKLAVGAGLALAIKAVLKAPLLSLFGGHASATALRYFLVVVFAGIVYHFGCGGWPTEHRIELQFDWLCFPLWFGGFRSNRCN